jgi:glycosyltransferase involved in cell wall biosynthesis
MFGIQINYECILLIIECSDIYKSKKFGFKKKRVFFTHSNKLIMNKALTINPLVSIALATYNGEEFLDLQLQSIYNQTYKNIEVIVTDDQSTDKTHEILDYYKLKYGLVYYINEHHLGITKNFEKALSYCSGNYIALCDQDDIWFPQKIETLLQNTQGANLVYSDGYILDPSESHKKISEVHWLKPFGIDSDNQDLYKYSLLSSFILGCSILLKKELLEHCLPFPENFRNHDWWLILCAQNYSSIKFVDLPLFQYRRHENNNSKFVRKSAFKNICEFWGTEQKIIREERYSSYFNLLKSLAEYDFPKNLEQKQFLLKVIESLKPSNSIFNKIRSFFFFWRNNKYIFPQVSYFYRIIFSLSKLITKNQIIINEKYEL